MYVSSIELHMTCNILDEISLMDMHVFRGSIHVSILNLIVIFHIDLKCHILVKYIAIYSLGYSCAFKFILGDIKRRSSEEVQDLLKISLGD